MKNRTKAVKYLLFLPCILHFALLFLLIFIIGGFIIFLTASALLAVPVALGKMIGFFQSVVSDLAPPALFFAGIFSGAGAVFLAVSLFFIFPFSVKHFSRIFDWYRL